MGISLESTHITSLELDTKIAYLRDLIAGLSEKIASNGTLICEHETRNLERFRAQEMALAAAMMALEKASDATKNAVDTAVTQLVAEKEIRYNERFNSQEVALKAAMSASEKAIIATKDALDTAMIASEKAITKAEISTEKRFESINEFRATLSDQQDTFVRKTEVDFRFLSLADKVEKITESQQALQNKGAGFNAAWVVVLGASTMISTLVAIAFAFLKIFQNGQFQ